MKCSQLLRFKGAAEGDPAIDALKEALNDSSLTMRAAALRALEKLERD